MKRPASGTGHHRCGLGQKWRHGPAAKGISIVFIHELLAEARDRLVTIGAKARLTEAAVCVRADVSHGALSAVNPRRHGIVIARDAPRVA